MIGVGTVCAKERRPCKVWGNVEIDEVHWESLVDQCRELVKEVPLRPPSWQLAMKGLPSSSTVSTPRKGTEADSVHAETPPSSDSQSADTPSSSSSEKSSWTWKYMRLTSGVVSMLEVPREGVKASG